MLEFWFYPRRQGVNGAVSHKGRGRRHALGLTAIVPVSVPKAGEYEFLAPAPKYRSVKAGLARRPQAVARV